jgi:hypothetical protein
MLNKYELQNIMQVSSEELRKTFFILYVLGKRSGKKCFKVRFEDLKETGLRGNIRQHIYDLEIGENVLDIIEITNDWVEMKIPSLHGGLIMKVM